MSCENRAKLPGFGFKSTSGPSRLTEPYTGTAQVQVSRGAGLGDSLQWRTPRYGLHCISAYSGCSPTFSLGSHAGCRVASFRNRHRSQAKVSRFNIPRAVRPNTAHAPHTAWGWGRRLARVVPRNKGVVFQNTGTFSFFRDSSGKASTLKEHKFSSRYPIQRRRNQNG